jgi:hypothetical protein
MTQDKCAVMKYAVVGILNVIFGFVEAFFTLSVMVFTIPKLSYMYTELGVEIPNLFSTYLILFTILLIGIGNLFVGMKLFSKSERKDVFFKYGLVLVIISLILSGAYISITLISVMQPIYGLYSQL